MTVLDLIGSRADIYAIPEGSTVHQAARYLRGRQVRAVGVIDSSGEVVGVVSQSDISDKVAAENKCPAWMRVDEIMSTALVCVTLHEHIDDCLRLMDQHGVYHLLVIDEHAASPRQRYRGMLSVSDLLRGFASDEKSRADLLEAFVFEPRVTA